MAHHSCAIPEGVRAAEALPCVWLLKMWEESVASGTVLRLSPWRGLGVRAAVCWS